MMQTTEPVSVVDGANALATETITAAVGLIEVSGTQSADDQPSQKVLSIYTG